MNRPIACGCILAVTLWLMCIPAAADGDGSVTIRGEHKQWHKITLTLDGPFADERDADVNPFTDYRMTVRFAHESGSPVYDVPGYFAADGDAANSSAQSGQAWRAHLTPDKPGGWTYHISFVQGKNVSVDDVSKAAALPKYDGQSGRFNVAQTDKTGRDLRARGRLQYVGRRYLRFAGTGEYFLKAGADAPETLLAYADFDGTEARKSTAPLKTWQPHVRDWRPGDPTWQNGKGTGLIGAINYLADKGCNAFSFLPYNAGGDGDNVWPFVQHDDKLHYDCSKLDQWQIVIDHAQSLGLYLHFKLQETENDDNRLGDRHDQAAVAAALDGGELGRERKLYCRELIARFGYALALNWNLGEENTQSPSQQRAMAAYIRKLDPYDHPIVVHTYPQAQDDVYAPLLGDPTVLTGVSLQNSWQRAHQRTLHWVRRSTEAGHPWVVAHDEQNPASCGVPPDPGYQGHDGNAVENGKTYNLDDIRKYCLWGTLMAGGAGVEYYFGYDLPQNDLTCEDWRSRDRSWDYCRIAIEFFRQHQIPFWEMENADALVGNPDHSNSRYCFARPNHLYLVYLPTGGGVQLDLRATHGSFAVWWFDPRRGRRVNGTVRRVEGGQLVPLGDPPYEPTQDWLVVVTVRNP